MNTYPFSFIQPSASSSTVTYVTNSFINSAQTTYDFNSISIGGPGLVVIGVHTENFPNTGATLSSVTLNGSATTINLNVKNETQFNNGSISAIASIRVISGTTADIQVNFASFAPARAGISIWSIRDNISDVPITTAQSDNSNDRDITFTGLTSNNNLGVCVFTSQFQTGTPIWSGATSDYTTIWGTSQASGALFTTTTSGTRDVSVSYDFNGTTLGGVVWN
jgi:hypothetical protein